MGRRLSNKKAFSDSVSSSVWFLIPAGMLINYAEGDTLGEATGTPAAPAGQCLLTVVPPHGCISLLLRSSVAGSSCCRVPWESSVTRSRCPHVTPYHPSCGMVRGIVGQGGRICWAWACHQRAGLCEGLDSSSHTPSSSSRLP